MRTLFFVGSLMVSGMAAAADDAALQLQEGSYRDPTYWAVPCTPMRPTPEHRVERFTDALVRQAGIAVPGVVRCVQPAGHSAAVVKVGVLAGGRLLIVYNEEMDTQVSDLAMRGLIAHELAHYATDCGVPPYTEEQYFACEMRVDRRAAELVGTESLLAALTEFQNLHAKLATTYTMRLNAHVMSRRMKLKEPNAH